MNVENKNKNKTKKQDRPLALAEKTISPDACSRQLSTLKHSTSQNDLSEVQHHELVQVIIC